MAAQQNLVPNGSFEEFDTCPNNQGQVAGYVKNWFDPTFASSDYFNICATNIISGVPNNFYGYSYPFHGDAYIGLATYEGNASASNWREYIGTKLISALIPNNHYCFSAKLKSSNAFRYNSNNFGISLYKDTIGVSQFYPYFIMKQPTYNNTAIIYDTINWVDIKFEFIADSNYNYIILGNFFNDSLTQISENNLLGYEGSYLFIDSVSLIECKSNNIIPNVFSPNEDGANDTWEFIMTENTNCVVYNRWGIKVFETNEKVIKWDGRTTSGELCSEGTYYYIIQTETETHKGFLEIFK